MTAKIALTLFLLGVALTTVLSQENAGKIVASALQECYKVHEYLDKDSRPPATLNVVLDLLRKIENGPSRKDARQFSAEILHRFRQDGITKLDDVVSNFTLPYSPVGRQSEKSRILLKSYIPGNAQTFPNETLTAGEACALHFMMSNTVELAKRNDEGYVCNKMGRYQRRTKRANPPNPSVPSKRNNSDIEVFPRMKPFTGELSECPIEDGVVYTRWGAIQLGTVIAGIATGIAQQNERITEYDQTFEIDSSFAATLAGDVAEVAISYGPYNKIKVGATGVWNSSVEPRHYFINENENYLMTDAEVRAGADGLVMAKNIQEWLRKQSLLKISQVLDMYYSQRGVFSNKHRACYRREAVMDVVAQDGLLSSQCIAFTVKYNREAGGPSIGIAGIENFSKTAITKFFEYTGQMDDIKCSIDNDPIVRAATDLVIVVDTSFNYQHVIPSISYLLDNLDINMYGSNVTIINGEDGAEIVSSTSSILEYFAKYNRTTHLAHPMGFKFTNVYTKMEAIVNLKANQDKASNNVGGRSLVFLLMPTNTPSDQDKSYIVDRMEIFKSRLPAFQIVVAGRSPKDAYNSLVFNPTYDIFQLRETISGSEIASSMGDVVKRIKQYPRRIANPKCGSDWNNEVSSNSLDQYIEPNTTNTYAIAANYLFGEQEKTLKIKFLTTSANIKVCFPNGDCKTGNQEISYTLTNYCADHTYIKDCPSFIFSVAVEETRVTGCTESGCRFPDNAKYTISIEGLGCQSGSSVLLSSLSLVFIVMAFIKMM